MVALHEALLVPPHVVVHIGLLDDPAAIDADEAGRHAEGSPGKMLSAIESFSPQCRHCTSYGVPLGRTSAPSKV